MPINKKHHWSCNCLDNFNLYQDDFAQLQELGTVLARIGERMTDKELLAMVAEVGFKVYIVWGTQ